VSFVDGCVCDIGVKVCIYVGCCVYGVCVNVDIDVHMDGVDVMSMCVCMLALRALSCVSVICWLVLA